MINALYLRHVSWKSRMDMLVEKLTPLWGFPGNCQKTTAPDAPASLFLDPNRAQIKDRIDNKTVEKKGVPTPSGRAHHRWCSWVGRKIGGAFQKPVAFTKGWMTGHGKRPPTDLTCPCFSEDVVLRYVSGYSLNQSPKNSEHIPDQGRNPRAPIAGTETC